MLRPRVHQLVHSVSPPLIMSSLRPFEALDLFRLNPTNLDSLTENYDISFYLTYLAKWPSLFNVIEGPHGEVDAYSPYSPNFYGDSG